MTFWDVQGWEQLVDQAQKYLGAGVIVEEKYFVISTAKVFGVSEEVVWSALNRAEELEYEADKGELLNV